MKGAVTAGGSGVKSGASETSGEGLSRGGTPCAGPSTSLALSTARFLLTRTRSLRAHTGRPHVPAGGAWAWTPRHQCPGPPAPGCPAAVAPRRAEACGVTRPGLCLVPQPRVNH